MKKIGLICLAVVLTLGIGGVGFGWWSETLDIGQNQVDTGELNATFCDGWNIDGSLDGRGLISNDDGVSNEAYWINNSPAVPDPDDAGGDPTACQTQGVSVDRTQDIASTTVTGDGTKTATVTITTAYPSYHATIFFCIRNWGTIPAKVKSIKVIEVSVNGSTTTVDIPLQVDVPVYLNCDGDGDNDLALQLSNPPQWHDLYGVMEAGGHGNYSEVNGDLCIHVEEGAEEYPTTYDFTVEIVVVPFNG